MFNNQCLMINVKQNVQECDAREDDKGPSAGAIIIIIVFQSSNSFLIIHYSLTRY